MITRLSTDQVQVFASLFQALRAFDEAQFNQIPFPGSWTPAQVAEHIRKFASGTLKVIHGPVAVTERSPDEQLKPLKDLFLNMRVKMPAPESVVPRHDRIPLEKLLSHLKDVSETLDEAIHTTDLSATCTAYQLPGFKLMTRLEWVHFILYHMQRHIYQLEHIQLTIKSITTS
jgi:hypothetical protein